MFNRNRKRLSAEVFSSAQRTTKTKREQPKPRREWQYNAEKHKGKTSASRVLNWQILAHQVLKIQVVISHGVLPCSIFPTPSTPPLTGVMMTWPSLLEELGCRLHRKIINLNAKSTYLLLRFCTSFSLLIPY